jgi:hypothetical protein
MTIKRIPIVLLLLAIASVVQWSCVPDLENGSKEEAYSYPLDVGNSWKYDVNFRSENYRKYISDSNFVPVDTMIMNDSMTEQVTIDRIDSTTVDVETRVMRDSMWNSNSADTTQNSVASWFWYRNNQDGLYMYAYASTGHGAMPKKAAGKGIRYKGMAFANPSLLAVCIFEKSNTGLVKQLAGVSFPTVYPTPRKILLYPYSADSLWDYNPNDSNVRIARKYIGKEKVKCKAGTFECYKVQWLWDWDLDGNWDDDWEEYDWISPQYGLIKRFHRLHDFEEWTEGGIVAKFDGIQEYQATEISIKDH